MHKHYRGTIASVNITEIFKQKWMNEINVLTNDVAIVTLSKPIPDYYFVQQNIPQDRVQYYQHAVIQAAKLPTGYMTLNNTLFIAGYGNGKLKLHLYKFNATKYRYH